MDFAKVIDISQLHHAYLLEDAGNTFQGLQDFLHTAHGDAEVYVREFDSLGIDDSRSLLHLAQMRSLGTQLFIFRVRSCTHEAQNALLKLFEEPPAHTHFFLCVQGSSQILPTLRSRLLVLVDGEVQSAGGIGKQFATTSHKERMALIEPIIKEKNVTAASILLTSLEQELHAAGAHRTHAQALHHLSNVRRLLNDKGASLKVLLESVVLITPQLS